jgi:hypothetical protein
MPTFRRFMFWPLTLISMINLFLVGGYFMRVRDPRVISLLAMGIAVVCAWGVLVAEYRKVPISADPKLYQRILSRIEGLALFVNIAVGAGIGLLQNR